MQVRARESDRASARAKVMGKEQAKVRVHGSRAKARVRLRPVTVASSHA